MKLPVFDRSAILDKLLSRCEKSGDCFVWTGAKVTDGYGTIRIAGKSFATHRLSYELLVGEIPEGLQVLHSCDNPPCVKKNHLFLGTTMDNVADSIKKGRRHIQLKGEKSPNSKLTNSVVREIKDHLRAGETVRTIASRFRVSHASVWLISAGKTWRHVS